MIALVRTSLIGLLPCIQVVSTAHVCSVILEPFLDAGRLICI